MKSSSNAAIVFSPEEKDEIVLFWLVEEETVATMPSTVRRVWHEILCYFPVHHHFQDCEPFCDRSHSSNTHGISECRSASVASTRRSSMPHGNPPLLGPNVPSPTVLYELSNADTPFPFDVELCKISFFFSLRGNFQSSIPYSTTNVHAASVFDS